MKQLLQRLLDQFEARTIRERLLIGVTAFAVTWGVWIASIGGWVIDDRHEVVTSIDRLAQDLRLQEDERQRLRALDATPLRQALEKQQARLESQLALQQAELDALLTRFIPPEDVPRLLEDVLQDHDGLKLLRLSSRPAQPLVLDVTSGTADESDVVSRVKIYRHPVQLEFSGGYLDVMAYLNALEGGDWRFAWRKFEYTVQEYPRAQVMIELETLSREKEWLGV